MTPSHEKMNKNSFITKTIPLFAIFLLILSLSLTAVSAETTIQTYALQYDFYSGAEMIAPSLCAGSSVLDRILIQNTASFGAIFEIDTNLPEYVTIPTNSVQLEPGEQVYIDLLISAPKKTEAVMDYQVIIKTNLGKEQIIDRDLTITNCQTIEATLYSEFEEINPCQENKYEIVVKNPSTMSESYLIQPTKYTSYFDTEAYELNLGAGKEGKVEFNLEMACSEYGKKEVEFMVYAVNSGLSAKLNHKLTIEQNYSFELNIEENLFACMLERNELYFEITNNGAVSNEYTLNLVGEPSFVELSQTTINLTSEESATISIITLPPENREGTYKFSVTAKSAVGDQEIKKQITLSVNNCYDVYVYSENIVDVCPGDAAIPFTISNNGEAEAELNLTAYGLKSPKLSEESITVAPGEEKTVFLEVTFPDSETDYSDYFSVYATNPKVAFETNWNKEVKVNVKNLHSCSLVNVIDSNINVRYTDTYAIFNVKNTGAGTQTYDVELLASEWLRLDADEITLEQGQTGSIYVSFYNDASEIQEQYFGTLILSAQGTGIQYTQEVSIRFNPTPWYEEMAYYMTGTLCKIFTLAFIVLLLIAIVFFIVRLSMKRSTYKMQATFKWLLVALAIIILIVAYFVIGLPQSHYPPLEGDESDDLSFVWYEDEQLQIDLSEYFSDPDNDTLTFDVNTSPSNISIFIDGSIATLLPDQDYSGKTSTRFSAKDESGESGISPRIYLQIIEVPDFDTLGLYEYYCQYVNVALLLLIIIFIIATPWRKKPKESSPKVMNTKIKKEKGYRYYVDADGDVARAPTSSGQRAASRTQSTVKGKTVAKKKTAKKKTSRRK